MATYVETAPTRTPPNGGVATEPLKVVPVKYWAFAGAVISAFMLYVVLRWVTEIGRAHV